MIKQMQKKWLYAMIISLLAFSCSEDEVPPVAIASFQFQVSPTDFRVVNFTNFSQNAVSYSWNFGDGSAASTAKDPSHTYATEGTFTVVLTATGAGGDQATKEEQIVITDPDVELKKLTGETSKTWKLYRVGTSMSLGPNAASPAEWWSGLTNNGARPCLYTQTFTFTRAGKFIFDDKGAFWAEYGLFNNVPNCNTNVTAESCIDATVANMKNACGADISKWLSGTHNFTYNASTGVITLSGLGAWIGIPKLGTSDYTLVPVSEVKIKVAITEETGFDLMTVTFDYGANGLWTIRYASYDNPLDEPAIETGGPPPFGEDLPDITPTTMGHTFETATSFDLLGAFSGASIITVGADDPISAANTKVGKFERVAGIQYQEAKLRAHPDLKDIQFTNMTKVSMDVYLPGTNDYSGLNKRVVIGLADESKTEQWWTRIIQYESGDLATDSWVTVTFQLDAPAFASESDTPFSRNDIDMVYITIGGTDRLTGGTFYIRNLKFE
jgi:PKD repeat protein